MPPQAVYFTGERAIEVRETSVSDPGPGELTVEATVSAISPGTELLLYRGEVSPETVADETLDSLGGSFVYPFPYGYATVGTVTAVGPEVDPAWRGETVLAFHPHASEFVVGVDDVSRVPDGVTPEQAVFLPNVETAVTLTLDGEPAVGERVVVFGQGVIGLLTTAVLSTFPLESLVTVESHPLRRDLSTALGADRSVAPGDVDPAALAESTVASVETEPQSVDGPRGETASPERADLTYELSGNPAALSPAIEATGYDGRVVVGSWYGTKPVTLALDDRFHRSRIDLRASQVSTLAPARRGRWTVGRRLQTAWRRLRDVETERLVTDRVPVESAPAAYRRLDEHPDEAVQVLLTY